MRCDGMAETEVPFEMKCRRLYWRFGNDHLVVRFSPVPHIGMIDSQIPNLFGDILIDQWNELYTLPVRNTQSLW